MNERTKRVVNWAVSNAARDAVNGVVWEVVFWSVRAAVDEAVWEAVHGAVHGVRQPDPEHPNLQEFLHSCGAEMGTQ